MIEGILLTIFALTILFWQLRKTHKNRNVVILFLAFVLVLYGLWSIFDWVVIQLFLS